MHVDRLVHCLTPTELPDAVVEPEFEQAEPTPVLPPAYNPTPYTAVAENVPQPQEKRTRVKRTVRPPSRYASYHCIELLYLN